MSILNQRRKERARIGARIVIYGQEKMGKTTLACDAPNALLVPTEDGFAGVDVEHVPLLEWYEHVISLQDEILTGLADGSFDPTTTLVWDSVTAIERLMQSYTMRSDPRYDPADSTMNSVHGGYGKGWAVLVGHFGAFLNKLDRIRAYGVNNVLIGHTITSSVIDPAYGEYQQHDIALYNPKSTKSTGTRELLTQWADAVFFLHEPLFVRQTERGKGDNKEIVLAQGISKGVGRVLETERTPAWVAGNRYKLTGSIPIPMEGPWNYLAQAIHNSIGIDLYKR